MTNRQNRNNRQSKKVWLRMAEAYRDDFKRCREAYV